MNLSFYKNLKIQTKFTIIIILAILIPFLILALVFSNRLYDMIVSETIKNAQDSAANTSPKIAEQLDSIIDISNSITSNSYFEELFFTSTGGNPDEICDTKKAKNFKAIIKDYEKENDINVRIYMAIPDNAPFFESRNSKNLFYPIARAKGTYWYGIFQGSKASKLYCPPSYLSNSERTALGDTAYITYMTTYYDGEIYPCYLAIYYSSKVYQQILTDNINTTDSVSYIINDREEIVATTDAALSATYRLQYADIENSLLSSNSFISQDVLGEKVYVAFYYLSNSKWFIVSVIPEKPLLFEGKIIIIQFALIVIVCLLAASLLAIILSRSITDRISKVAHQMSLAKHGLPKPLEPSDANDEVGELIDTYNYMTKEMRKLVQQEKKTAENLRIAEFDALQAQINPHFLYNTMDMINWMSKEGKNEEVSYVVQRLSRFYKLTLSQKNTINSIADELEHTKIYVELMNMRHGNAIDLVIDMPDELTSFSIPKLTLQPIVENAIIHGILEKPDKNGTILITGWEQDDDIVLIVSDDGIGMDEETLSSILNKRPLNKTRGSNVAIYNTHQRLVILCGEGYGLTYSSAQGTGTEVTIRIPVLIG